MDANNSEIHPLFPKPVSISKVIAPLVYKRAIVRAIEELGEVEPIQVDPRTGSDEMKVEDRRNKVESYQSTINDYLKALSSEEEINSSQVTEVGSTEDDVIDYLHEMVNKRAARIGEIMERRESIVERTSELHGIMDLLDKLEKLNISDTSILKDSCKDIHGNRISKPSTTFTLGN